MLPKSGVPPSAVLSLFQLTLHHLENIQLNNRLMVSLDVVLRNLTLADLLLFREDAPNRSRVEQNGYMESVAELRKPPFDKPIRFIKLFDPATQNALKEAIDNVKNNALVIAA